MTITTKRDSMINDIIDYLKENEETFNDLIEELDSWNGYLGDDKYYPMYDINELLQGKNIEDIINMVFYGSVNPNDDYFKFNGYGNLETSDYKDYSDYLDTYFINEVIENYNHLYINDEELIKLIEKVIEYDEETEE